LDGLRDDAVSDVLPSELVAVADEVLGRITSNCEDLSASMTKIGEEGQAFQIAKIEAGLEPPLSAGYAIEKAKEGFGGEPVLVKEGELIGSSSSHPGPQSVDFGFDDPVNAFHASLEPRSVMPLRDDVSVGDAFVDRAVELVADDVVRDLATEEG
jgi:hypothetical protein